MSLLPLLCFLAPELVLVGRLKVCLDCLELPSTSRYNSLPYDLLEVRGLPGELLAAIVVCWVRKVKYICKTSEIEYNLTGSSGLISVNKYTTTTLNTCPRSIENREFSEVTAGES